MSDLKEVSFSYYPFLETTAWAAKLEFLEAQELWGPGWPLCPVGNPALRVCILLQPQTSNLVLGILLLWAEEVLGCWCEQSVQGGSSLLVSWWLIQMQTSPRWKQRRIKTPRTAETHGEELRCHSVAPAGVCAQSQRPLIKEWFIGAGRRGLLSNSSSEWDFSSGRGRVNQTLGREACKAQW